MEKGDFLVVTSDRSKKSSVNLINENIKAKEVKLVDQDGEMLGVMSFKDALEKAKSASLDLVQIGPDSNLPVCKLLDYGKYLYTQQKKKQEAKKKQKIVLQKELYIHIAIAEHDYQVKLKQIHKFLKESAKVKLAVKLRGREFVYNKKAVDLLNRFLDDISKDIEIKIESPPKLEGNSVNVIFTSIG